MKNQNTPAWIVFILLMTLTAISASVSSDIDNTLNELYERLLQREYAGPISLPDHQVERKAQRSPSLRLRFGRSDPDMVQLVEKRWLGDVNQKPIRSPSLRLRFGRRSDPLMAASEQFDLDNDLSDIRGFERQERKPSGRLRWGRSIPLEQDDTFDQEKYQRNPLNAEESETLLAILSALRGYDENQMSSNEFEREIRKPAPLRLRWGRSADTFKNTDQHKTVNNANEKASSNDVSTPQSIKV